MNAVLGFTSLLRRQGLSARNLGYLDTIEGAGRRLSTLINDVLDLSKAESDLRISMRPVAGGRFRLRFAVVDTGPGIPAVLQNAVFEPFNQVHAWTDPKAGRVGLGLSISKHLVALMGGEIRLRSEQDVGSTFTLDLPEVARAEPRAAGSRVGPRCGTALPCRCPDRARPRFRSSP